MIDEWDNRNSDLKLPLEKTTDNCAETKTRYPLKSAVKHFPTIKSAPLYTTCEHAEMCWTLWTVPITQNLDFTVVCYHRNTNVTHQWIQCQ